VKIKLIFSVLLILVSLGSLIGFAYALTLEKIPSSDTKSKLLPKILLQIYLYNSEGHLVSYVEGTEIVLIYKDPVNYWLDSLENNTTITKDGKRYEVFFHEFPKYNFNRNHSYAAYTIELHDSDGIRYSEALFINHEAYLTEPGDVGYYYMTIMRPII